MKGKKYWCSGIDIIFFQDPFYMGVVHKLRFTPDEYSLEDLGDLVCGGIIAMDRMPDGEGEASLSEKFAKRYYKDEDSPNTNLNRRH